MTKETHVKSHADFQKELAQLIDKRAVLWRAKMDETHPGERIHEVSPREARMAVLKAENHPDVLAIQSEINILHAEMIEAHGDVPSDPGLTEEESDARAAAEGRPLRYTRTEG